MLTVKLEGLDKAYRLFDARLVDRAAKFGINDTTRKVRTAAGRGIREIWKIRAAYLNKRLRAVKMARAGDLEAIIQAKSRPISLVHFGATQLGVARFGRNMFDDIQSLTQNLSLSLSKDGLASKDLSKRRIKAGLRGVEVNILRGKKTFLPNAFIAPAKNGHVGVFRRVGKKRFPIKNLSTITIASMFNQEPVEQVTLETIEGTWPRRFNYHLDRLMDR